MHKLVMRLTIACGAIVGAACVYDAPVTPGTNTITAATTAIPSLQLSASATGTATDRYLVVLKPGKNAGPDIDQELSANGGRLEGLHNDLGFAVVSGISSDAAARLGKTGAISSVEPDVEFTIEPMGGVEAVEFSAPGTESATAPHTAQFFGLQWNMRAIAADAAWARGFLGSSTVSVAILDTGIDYRWPDLVGRVDLNRSISLRPDEDARLAFAVTQGWFPSGLHPITDLNTHGSVVSTIVASNSNGVAGVTTRTTLFGVKVCTMFDTCSTAAILNGILYAVDHGADVINMSLGGAFLKSGSPGFVSVINRVFNYAKQNGTLIVVAAGNSAANLDANPNVYFTYCDAPHVLCVSATGPTAAGSPFGPFQNPDAFAPYSNYGNAISLAAPGGGLTNPSTANVWVAGPCSETWLAWHQPPRPAPGAPLPPVVIDGPICPRSGGFFIVRGAGTSFSSPHVAGVAAAVIASTGRGNPAQVSSLLRSSSDDLGKTGRDPLFGSGRLNAARALGLIP